MTGVDTTRTIQGRADLEDVVLLPACADWDVKARIKFRRLATLVVVALPPLREPPEWTAVRQCFHADGRWVRPPPPRTR